MAEAITLTGRTRRRLVEIDALVALGGSRIARPSSERVPDRVSYRVSTHDFRTIQARPKDPLSPHQQAPDASNRLRPAGSYLLS
jgi:hypothetical protein